jgi:hypothetical protein
MRQNRQTKSKEGERERVEVSAGDHLDLAA